ncbi:MAG TPA: M23 family metallopeptidase [Ohtaekwangia sp.]
MKQPKYVYNSQNCQYEPARITFKDVFFYVFGLLFASAVFFVAIVFLQNKFVQTDYEIALRAENKVLQKHKPVLEASLNEIEATLKKLQGEEQTLYTKLFNAPPPSHAAIASTLPKDQVLLADASGFKSLLSVLNEESSRLLEKSSKGNAAFSDRIKLNQKDLLLLTSIPSIQPVSNPDMNSLASGFGQRINPFHKGTYFHPGIDFIAPRGSDVVATAPGRVISISKNDLQAGYGNQIVIDHGNGFTTRYAHLEEIHVRYGEKIIKGKVIGTVGNSGGSIAPHLHYEITHNGEPVNPVLYFIEGLSSSQHQELIDLSKKQNQSLD